MLLKTHLSSTMAGIGYMTLAGAQIDDGWSWLTEIGWRRLHHDGWNRLFKMAGAHDKKLLSVSELSAASPGSSSEARESTKTARSEEHQKSYKQCYLFCLYVICI